ncbi:protein RRP6-like 3 isoform X2 [Pyrus x bretschneideri]|uniref:protein RRP6-like 3 isoform X2 n=1 Tax=Pyrus x bretschneideri TaxID=225117 RepID=UPI00202F9903|nr:protein RRP6-like 3 isoform X2 [Pyrus x bretschneideri]
MCHVSPPLPPFRRKPQSSSFFCFHRATESSRNTKMEAKGSNLKIAVVALASLTALSVFFFARHRRRRRNANCPLSRCYLRADHLKPQYGFKRVLADNSYSPFKHLNLNGSPEDKNWNSHPYEAEITGLMESFQLEEFRKCIGITEKNVGGLEEMSESYEWVETESKLKELVEVLSKEKVFAVDTEQHSFRSFLGFTALIQISTEKEDYLVDTIALHDCISLLRLVFADASICKVFHGADSDVLWLQRDFHIYVVNMFDTAKACEVLSKPQKSLAYLLESYCGVVTNKLLQREDWRQRPLSIEMVQYARTDAHYLLYIAHSLIAELEMLDNENTGPNDKLHFVLEASRRSNSICLQLYTKEIEASPGESAASSIFSRHLNGQGGISSVSPEVQDAVNRLCAWRDLMARVHDESLRYVISDQAIVALADKAPTNHADKAPTNPADILTTIAEADSNADSSFSSGLSSPSPVVYSHLDDFRHLLHNKIGNPDNFFSKILQNCLGPNGSCPLSIFNYALLVECNMKVPLTSRKNGLRNSKQVARKSSRQLFVQKFSCKAPVYHNCRIYADDGRLLCYCDRRKLEWYLRRDLAKLVDENPPAIMLLFEPKGRPEDEGNDFYIQSKKNICVSCGERNHYLRYRIIPSCYRMHFPEHLKSHRSHDIVLLCVDCHEIAHASAEKYKKHIAAEFGIPLFVRRVFDSEQSQATSESSVPETTFEEPGVSPLQLRIAAMALLRHGPRMPSSRREELTEIVMRYYGGRQISEEDLENALLVGMSPNKRKRFEKKKGLSLKHSKGIIQPDAEQERTTITMYTSAIVNASEADTLLDSCTTEAEAYTGTENGDAFMLKDADLGTEEEAFAVVEKNMNSDISGVAGSQFISVVNADGDGDGDGERETPNGSVDFSHAGDGATSHRKRRSKMSLLGHGPHGKQVVDHLLKEYGEDGISQFCQRWRQVFVESLHPRFLPAGWDITHRG